MGVQTTASYLIRTGDDLGELALVLILALDNGFDDAGVVGAQVHKGMCYARVPQGFEEGE
jgi:hypothetical protein